MRIRKNDHVQVIAGRDKGKRGRVLHVLPENDRVVVEGVATIKNNPQRIREVNKELEPLGASVKAQWSTLGRFDFINVVEAPDDVTMARVSLELGSRGTAQYETLAAQANELVIAAAMDLRSPARILRTSS